VNLPGTSLSAICSLEAEQNPGTLILRLHGEFDLSTDERFQQEAEKVLTGDVGTLIVDLRGLTFMDSTGLRELVALQNRSAAANVDFAVLHNGGTVARLLRATGLDRVLPTVHTDSPITPRTPV
jgi:anti-sigma B factor antagonist